MKKSIVLFGFLALLIFWLFSYHFSPFTVAETSITASSIFEEQQHTKTPQLTPNSQKIQDHSLTSKKAKDKSESSILGASCTTDEQLMSHPSLPFAQAWFENAMGENTKSLTNLYAFSTEEELLRAAEQGDATAMLALGINYEWQATHINFQSPQLRPKDLPELEYRSKPIDHKTLKQARYWLMQAALNNQLNGIHEIAFSYSNEAHSLEDSEHKTSLIIKAVAYLKLLNFIFPDTVQPMSDRLSFREDIDKQQLLEQEFSTIKAKWQSDRIEIGMSRDLGLRLPEEVKVIFQLQQNLCRQD